MPLSRSPTHPSLVLLGVLSSNEQAALKKPMGVVFEENDPSSGGVFVASLAADGAAQTEGTLKAGDQLVAVNGSPVLGLSFDDSLEKIIESDIDPTELIVFR